MTTATKERPILFSAPMIRALLDGRKTQTRRIIKPQPEQFDDGWWRYAGEIFLGDEAMRDHLFHEVYGTKGTPYGSLYEGGGDRIWVRETFNCLHPITEEIIPASPRQGVCTIAYAATEQQRHAQYPNSKLIERWRPSIFMPRWASRITLEITDVCVDRLQEIGEEEAIAEGIKRFGTTKLYGYDPKGTPGPLVGGTAIEGFALLWESINGHGSWAANPWVWAITFKRV